MANNLMQQAQQFMKNVVQNKNENEMADVPWKQSAINAIMSGDQSKCQELAQNIMNSCGFSSPQEAIQQGLTNLNGKK